VASLYLWGFAAKATNHAYGGSMSIANRQLEIILPFYLPKFLQISMPVTNAD